MPVYKDSKSTKDGRSFYFIVSYTNLNGEHKQYKSKKYTTKKEAVKEEAIFLLSVKQPESVGMTFREIIEKYLTYKESKVKPTTMVSERKNCNYVNDKLGNVIISKLNLNQYNQYLNIVNAENWSISYKNKMLKQVRVLILFAKNNYGIYNDIPFKVGSIKDNNPAKEMKFWTPEQFKQFISVADNDLYKSLFTVLFFTGGRLNEINSLTVRDINFDKNTLTISKSVSTKTKDKDGNYLIQTPKTKSSIRTIPMSSQVSSALASVIASGNLKNAPNGSKWLFLLPESSITKVKDRWVKASGVDNIRLHDFRHSFASMVANNGGSLLLLSKMLGHSNSEITAKVYQHLFPSELDKLVEIISKI